MIPGFLARKQPRDMRQVSARQAHKNRLRARPRDAQLAEFPYCEASRAGAPGDCYGPLTVHEPWTRARGGPTNDRRNMVTCCEHHNTAISQDVPTMRWALARGFLVRAAHGPRWLAAGGFKRE